MIVRLTLLDSFCTLHRFNTVCIFGQIFVVLTKSYPPSRSTMIECQIHVVLSPDLTPGQESSALPPPIWAFGLTDPSLGERFDLSDSSLTQCSVLRTWWGSHPGPSWPIWPRSWNAVVRIGLMQKREQIRRSFYWEAARRAIISSNVTERLECSTAPGFETGRV